MDSNIYQLIAIKSPAANELMGKVIQNWSQWEEMVDMSGILKKWKKVEPSYTKEKCSAQIFFDAVFLFGTLELGFNDLYVKRYMYKYTHIRAGSAEPPVEFVYLNNWINSL